MRKFILVTALAVMAIPVAPTMARATSGYTIRSTNMRAGPAYDYPTVRRIRSNAQVYIHGCLRNWSWCDTSYRSDRGWVAGRDLVVNYRGRRRGISSYLGISVLTFMFGNYWDHYYRNRPFYRERTRWERHYYDNYQPHWGPRPPTPPAYQRPKRQPAPQVRPDTRRRNQAVAPTRQQPAPQVRPDTRRRNQVVAPPWQQPVPAQQRGKQKSKPQPVKPVDESGNKNKPQ